LKWRQKINNQQSKSEKNSGKEDTRSVVATTGGQQQHSNGNSNGNGNGNGDGCSWDGR
jgi:hypothetical protein